LCAYKIACALLDYGASVDISPGPAEGVVIKATKEGVLDFVCTFEKGLENCSDDVILSVVDVIKKHFAEA